MTPKINVGFFALVILLMGPMSGAHAETCIDSEAMCVVEATPVNAVSLTGCSSTKSVLWGGECIKYCTACNSGYTLTDTTYTGTCSNSRTVQYCSSGTSSTTCSAITYSSSTCGTTPAYTLSNCSSSTKKCFGSAYVQTCNTCSSGTRTATTYKPSGCSNSYEYYYCKQSVGDGDLTPACFGDNQCTEGVGITVITGGTKTVTGKCVNAKCSYTTTYKCEAGYYEGSWLSAGCFECPKPGTSAEGADDSTQCYVKAGELITDEKGKYKFNADCYYDNSFVLPEL